MDEKHRLPINRRASQCAAWFLDEEVINALIEIADSRFQDELVKVAKDAGKSRRVTASRIMLATTDLKTKNSAASIEIEIKPRAFVLHSR